MEIMTGPELTLAIKGDARNFFEAIAQRHLLDDT